MQGVERKIPGKGLIAALGTSVRRLKGAFDDPFTAQKRGMVFTDAEETTAIIGHRSNSANRAAPFRKPMSTGFGDTLVSVVYGIRA